MKRAAITIKLFYDCSDFHDEAYAMLKENLRVKTGHLKAVKVIEAEKKNKHIGLASVLLFPFKSEDVTSEYAMLSSIIEQAYKEVQIYFQLKKLKEEADAYD